MFWPIILVGETECAEGARLLARGGRDGDGCLHNSRSDFEQFKSLRSSRPAGREASPLTLTLSLRGEGTGKKLMRDHGGWFFALVAQAIDLLWRSSGYWLAARMNGELSRAHGGRYRGGG